MPRNQKEIPQDFKGRLAYELGKDKKKTVILAMLMLVAAVMGFRLLFAGSGPAEAEGAASGAADPASRVERPGLGLANPQARARAQRLTGTGPSALDDWKPTRDRSGKIVRDLFAVKLNSYTPLVERDPNENRDPQVDPEAEKRKHRQLIEAKAANLSLQSTMAGEAAWAMINGRFVRQGGWIDEFQVVEIRSRSCVVQREGVTVELKLSQK